MRHSGAKPTVTKRERNCFAEIAALRFLLPGSDTAMSAQMPTLAAETRATESPVDLQEQVSRRAFELYERRGREDGRDLDDWLRAESELAPQRRKAVAA